jgi:putative ABC transport system permease protein
MPPLARRNLLHDKVRLAVTLTGIVFAVVLIVVELGLFVGFTVTTSSIIDKSNVDLWIVSRRTPYIEQGNAFSERKFYQVLGTAGVASAEKYIVHWAQWKTPQGAQESVQVVGFNTHTRLGGPWNLVAGRLEDLRTPDAIIMDELYKEKLGVTRIGDICELAGRRARVVGFTRGIRSPLVLTFLPISKTPKHIPAFLKIRPISFSFAQSPEPISRRWPVRWRAVSPMSTCCQQRSSAA